MTKLEIGSLYLVESKPLGFKFYCIVTCLKPVKITQIRLDGITPKIQHHGVSNRYLQNDDNPLSYEKRIVTRIF